MGVSSGTLAYMAPEQKMGLAEQLTAKVDVYRCSLLT